VPSTGRYLLHGREQHTDDKLPTQVSAVGSLLRYVLGIRILRKVQKALVTFVCI